MAMTFAEFLKKRADDAAKLANGVAPQGLETCCACNVPLQESKTGCHRCGDGKHVCSRCYYEIIGRELDDHPIGAARAYRRG